MHTSSPRSAAGFTFAELAFGLVLLVIGAVVLINHLAVNYQTTSAERERVFAFSKAQAILSEVQNFVDRGTIDAAHLDTFDDGTTNKPTLSIQTDSTGALVAPDHVISGNWQRNGQWHWSRRITVQSLASVDNRNVRYVTVRVYKKDAMGNDRALADLSAVVNSSSESQPSAQVYDVYMLAIENVPGWWVYMDSVRPFLEAQIMDLETRNPGLELRTHWITKASFGRNQLYRPYTNNVLDSIQTIPHVYNYPGRMPAGSASSFYYVPDNIKARMNVEGVESNGYDVDLNPHPYALADFFNHAMRQPDEQALWDARVQAVTQREQDIAAAVAAGSTPPVELGDMSKEPTLRLFLDDLYGNPTKYKNAIVINLHGEMTPMPALRNFSDAAKSQATYPNLRVVTHPEELRTRNNDAGSTDPLRFRMYSYAYQTSATPYAGPAVMADPMVVEFVGVDLTNTAGDPTQLTPSCVLMNVPGGVSSGPGSADYSTSWLAAVHATAGPLPSGMCYRAEWVPPVGSSQGFTRLYLFNTPVGAPQVITGGLTYGLAAGSKRARLYQMEYVPCPLNMDAAGVPAFTPDLTSAGVGPKNTARWTLRIDPSVLTANRFWPVGASSGTNPSGDVVLQVRTRIATGWSAGGVAWKNSGTQLPTPDDPDNLSVTYAWWTNSKEDVPISERCQYQGDPRHVPYKDCFRAGGDFPDAFNWFHDNLNNPYSAVAEPAITDFPAMAATSAASPLRNRWGGGSMACDTPRFLKMLRDGLVRSACVFTAVTGRTSYYVGVGNEIGYEAQNGYASSIPTNWTPYGVLFAWGYMNNVFSARRYVREAAVADYWWGMPWLGELFPDNQIAQWLDTAGGTLPPRGNLAAGTAASQFYQTPCNSAYLASGRLAYGTGLFNSTQRANTYGATTLFNIGTAASTFQHAASSTNGTTVAAGTEIGTRYSLTVPASAPISQTFKINVASTMAEHWDLPTYAPIYGGANRNTASLFQTYYTHAAGTGSGVVKLQDPGATSAAYVVVNGLAPTVTNGSVFIAQWNLCTLVHALLSAGDTANTLRIKEQPRVEIESPTDITELDNPSTINVQYATEWKRWDGLPYTDTGTFAENEAELQYCILYSRDGGTTWLHVQDDAPATPGERPAAGYLIADAGAGNESYAWDVSAGFPEGTYQLRIDCFRTNTTMHCAYHQTRLFIQR